MSGENIVEVVAIVVGAVVSLGTAYIALRMRQLEKQVDVMRATIASVHAMMLKTRQ